MLWMNQIFLHHVLWFLIKADFQNRDCADGVDFGKYISRFDQFRITCLISRELVSHDPNLHEAFRITWKCNFLSNQDIFDRKETARLTAVSQYQ